MGSFKKFTWMFGVVLIVAPQGVSAQTQQLPISVFVDAQASNVLPGWTDPATFRVLNIDTFGKRAEFFGLKLGTTIDGNVTIRELADGRAHVSVLVHTTNAACWGFQFGQDWTLPAVPAFGYSAFAVSQGLGVASLGEVMEHLEFTMPSVSAPMPSYYEVWGGSDYVLESDITSVNCKGELRSGSGYADGTPGSARTTQTVLVSTGVPSGCPPEKDASCAPTERIKFWPTGGR